MARRAAVLLHHLRMLRQSVVAQEAEGRYTVLPIAIEAWLQTAIANAEGILAELDPTSPLLEPQAAPSPRPSRKPRPSSVDLPVGDAPYPGGEHGGPAD